ncbi:hypothetical protein [Saccharopolyspora sp.]|uniref:hypothetical protein n=1 Tax=Saccharopolyspora sp. TaxID=33915 RepID=UPI0025D7E0D6|nr:hypothetical protein [Saccharopolyspora sp.]
MDTTPAPGDPAAESDVADHAVPALMPGTELIGEYQGSGHREPPYLVRRPDGQVLQVSRLLYLLAAQLDGRRRFSQVATALGDSVGREITAEQISFLIDNRLRKAGMVAAGADRPEQPLPKGRDRLLALRFRVALLPERVVSAIAGVFMPLFWPPVVVLVVAGFAVADIWLATNGAAGRLVAGAQSLIERPEQILLVLGLLTGAGLFHEFGHVAACRYGGARPGTMGVGIYLVWPAMYSTVTDSYRLSRGGRLRTDLGGIYFNALAILIMIVCYARTDSAWLLAALVAWQATTVWQFLPSIRLDGYYILSDLVGVPDLFDRMGPTLRSMVPGREPHPRVRELKPWTRRVIAVWVVLVIPCLAYWIIGFLALAPYVLPGLWQALLDQARGVGEFARAGGVAGTAVGLVRIFMLLLPWAGMTLVLVNLTRSFLRFLRNRRAAR